ncbi:MAG: gluconate 2-dehydrogenase subunit 3 family protein [Bacteroidetes bacterium]|nr:gluconate 2-dehydrogenase subunit 3 family protein [Bacteroidota bacterium]
MLKESRNHKVKQIHQRKESFERWQLPRKKFIIGSTMGGLFTSLPSISIIGQGINYIDVLSQTQLSLITSVQNILFPHDSNGPGAYDVMADKYLLWVLKDKRMDPEEQDYIVNGISWVEETAEENYSLTYSELSQSQKEKLITNIAKENWGKSWLGVILNFIFEALLSDPQYGGNPEGIGWDWLQHNPGFPRPTVPLLYPEILSTVSKNQ